MKVQVVRRSILQDGRVVFSCNVIVKPASADGKTPAETKPASLLLTGAQIETIIKMGDTVPKINTVIDAEWGVDAAGVQSQEWLSV